MFTSLSYVNCIDLPLATVRLILMGRKIVFCILLTVTREISKSLKVTCLLFS